MAEKTVEEVEEKGTSGSLEIHLEYIDGITFLLPVCLPLLIILIDLPCNGIVEDQYVQCATHDINVCRNTCDPNCQWVHCTGSELPEDFDVWNDIIEDELFGMCMPLVLKE